MAEKAKGGVVLIMISFNFVFHKVSYLIPHCNQMKQVDLPHFMKNLPQIIQSVLEPRLEPRPNCTKAYVLNHYTVQPFHNKHNHEKFRGFRGPQRLLQYLKSKPWSDRVKKESFPLFKATRGKVLQCGTIERAQDLIEILRWNLRSTTY